MRRWVGLRLRHSIGNERQYDVWGAVRSGSTSGDPNNRYCANLGHKQDDESGLIYMRARYYEPGTGRFISEDPAMHGLNWFIYCHSDPVNYDDSSGKDEGISGSEAIEFLEQFLERLHIPLPHILHNLLRKMSFMFLFLGVSRTCLFAACDAIMALEAVQAGEVAMCVQGQASLAIGAVILYSIAVLAMIWAIDECWQAGQQLRADWTGGGEH
ncbi:MAG: RHS repeat-associated core domain-containing protein [Fimbriimonadaceae bacterium]|nr:RHS repeat-associated core domain-containing protein [Fimbriimonadaceae bacterium]